MCSAPSVISLCVGHNVLRLRKDGALPTRFSIVDTVISLAGHWHVDIVLKGGGHVCFWQIVLQKSKVAALRIFRENEKRETIADSHTLNRVAEVVSGFNARGSVPPHLYTKDAPTARRIFGHLCKTTFATESALNGHDLSAAECLLSGEERTSRFQSVMSGFDPKRTFGA